MQGFSSERSDKELSNTKRRRKEEEKSSEKRETGISPSLTHKHTTMAEIVEGIVIPLDKGPLKFEMAPYVPEDLESPEDSLSNESVNPSPTESQMASPGVVAHPAESAASMPTDMSAMDASKSNSEEIKDEEMSLPGSSPVRIIGGSRHRVPGKYKCTQCDSTFSKPARLAQHMQTHSEDVRAWNPDSKLLCLSYSY